MLHFLCLVSFLVIPVPSFTPPSPSLSSYMYFLSSLLHVQCTSSLPSHLPSLPPPLPSLPPPPLPPAFRLLSSLLAPSCSPDNELPDYIMVMLANKKTFHQINNDLQLFLGSNTNHFTEWLQKATANPDTVVKKSGGNVYRLHEQYIHVHAGTHTCTCTCNAEVEYPCLSGERRHLPCINFKDSARPAELPRWLSWYSICLERRRSRVRVPPEAALLFLWKKRSCLRVSLLAFALSL